MVAEVERARVEGEVDGAGEHDDELHQRWPGIGQRRGVLAATKAAQVSAVAGCRAALASARRRPGRGRSGRRRTVNLAAPAHDRREQRVVVVIRGEDDRPDQLVAAADLTAHFDSAPLAHPASSTATSTRRAGIRRSAAVADSASLTTSMSGSSSSSSRRPGADDLVLVEQEHPDRPPAVAGDRHQLMIPRATGAGRGRRRLGIAGR